MKSLQQQLKLGENLKKRKGLHGSEDFIASSLSESPTGEVRLMEMILERENMNKAMKQVIKNKGAPGVDGMTVKRLKGYYRRHKQQIHQAVLAGTYYPLPVRNKEIAKEGGGVRELGIPVVLDRLLGEGAGRLVKFRGYDDGAKSVGLGEHLPLLLLSKTGCTDGVL